MYADLKKKRPAKLTTQQVRPPETVRFKVGTVYKGEMGRYVCVDRYNDAHGTHVGFVEVREHRDNLREDMIAFGGYAREREEGVASYDDYIVRTLKGVEIAVDENGANPDIGNRSGDGRFELDDDEDFDIRDYIEFKASSACGTEPLERKEKPEPNRHTKSRRKKGNPIVGLFIIVAILALIRACCS